MLPPLLHKCSRKGVHPARFKEPTVIALALSFLRENAAITTVGIMPQIRRIVVGIFITAVIKAAIPSSIPPKPAFLFFLLFVTFFFLATIIFFASYVCFHCLCFDLYRNGVPPFIKK